MLMYLRNLRVLNNNLFNRFNNPSRLCNRNNIYFRSFTTLPKLLMNNPRSQNIPHRNNINMRYFIFGSFFSFFKKNDDETPESKLVTTIKRGILCIQREEYNKAEQILHLALKMATDLQSKDGITYCYDVMANLAMEIGDFKKAENLFKNVMQRLFADGFKEDDNNMLHISSKIAHMAQLQGNLEKAAQGFKWTLDKLEAKLKTVKDDPDLLELWGLTKNWYGQLLLENKHFNEAKICFQEALDVFVKFHGKLNSEAIMMMNNLGVLCTNMNDIPYAESLLLEAIDLATKVPDFSDSAILKVNLGLLRLKQGLDKKAQELCSLAWKLGTKYDNKDVISQANYCLERVKLSTK